MKMTNPSPIAQAYLQDGHCSACPIIDMHGHLGSMGGAYLPAAPIDKMRHALRRAGVQTIVCAPHAALLGDVAEGNRLMQDTIDRYPEQFLGYWSVNPLITDAARNAPRDFARARGFVGFKLLPDYHTTALTDARYAPALEYADANRLLVLVHTWGGSPFNGADLVERVVTSYPGATFLMGHSCYGDWDAATRIAREHANAYLELTAVYVAHDFGNQPGGSGTPLPLYSCLHVNGILEYMVREATSRKIVFGTDLPWYSPHFAAGAVLFARISDDARHDILHRNAERLLTPTKGTH